METLLKIEELELASLPHLKEFSIECRTNEIVGVYGEINFGQEDLIDAICGLKKIKSGTIDLVEEFYAINHDSSIYEDLTVMENIEFTAEVYGSNADIYEILDNTGMRIYENKIIKTLPLALKKMAHISCSLVSDFKIMIIEEPSMSLDDKSNEKLWKILHDLKDEGKGVLIFTSKKIDLENCDRIYKLEEKRD